MSATIGQGTCLICCCTLVWQNAVMWHLKPSQLLGHLCCIPATYCALPGLVGARQVLLWDWQGFQHILCDRLITLPPLSHPVTKPVRAAPTDSLNITLF